MRIAHAGMAALFLLGAGVQVNDPDPLAWIVIYLAAAVLSGLAARPVTLLRWVPAVVGGIAVVWGLSLAARVPEFGIYGRMFDAWEMASVTIEEAREASGLFIIAAWMGVLAWRRRRPG
jgi:hypothetical protein